ncbi:MAG: AMP-binding protein, partial [Nocardioidaceae bacterium]
MGAYEQTYARSIDDPEGFWREAAGLVDWIRTPSAILDDSRPPFYRWYPDATLNTCYNALDRHVVAGRADQPALIHDSAMTGRVQSLTYAEMVERVAAFAGALRTLGVDRGDRVVIYLPMVPEAAVAMLACARLGAVHSVVFGGFAPAELAVRIDDALPKVVVSASCGLEPGRVIEYKPMLDEAIELAEHKPTACVLLQRPEARADLVEGRDIDYEAAMELGRADPAECVEVNATDPLYVLHTSGTTGKPKGIVRDNGGHAVALTWSMRNIFDIAPGQVMWAASDVGWVVGHSYIVYAPLLAGATTVMYEGKPVGTPDAGAFWRVIAQHGVDVLFTAPTAFRAIKKVDPDASLLAHHDTSSLRTLFLAGERLDPDTYAWATEVLGVPVVDNWWQTETGWPIVANPRGLEPVPLKAGSPSVPVPGYDVRVLDQHAQPVPPGTEGAICLKLPLPPGTLPTLWGDDDRYVSSYLSAYDGYYLSGDGGMIDEDGYVFVLGRTDDVINVAGHRLST